MHACFEEKKLVINYISLVYGYFFWRSPQIRSCLLLRARPGSSPLLAFFWSSYLLSAAVSSHMRGSLLFPASSRVKVLWRPFPAPCLPLDRTSCSSKPLAASATWFCSSPLYSVTPSCSLILTVSVPPLALLLSDRPCRSMDLSASCPLGTSIYKADSLAPTFELN